LFGKPPGCIQVDGLVQLLHASTTLLNKQCTSGIILSTKQVIHTPSTSAG
jgi:hypothetical protein